MTPALASAAGAIGGASARGSSHIHRNKPNQDARGGFVYGQWSIIAVSDGHGAAPYFRSERGARFAVEAVREAFTALSGGGQAGAADLDRLRAGLAALPTHIVAAWRKAVAADIASDPDARLAGGEPQVAYGATCIAAAFGPDVSIFTQIGDGDLLAAAPGGELVKPLPDDQGLEGEQTYSLCHDSAVAHFRTKLFVAPHPLATPGFAMASSDGLSKSFAAESQFFDVARHWRSIVEQDGMQAACGDLENWLARCSEMGSGDDNTLMMYCNSAAAVPASPPAATRGHAAPALPALPGAVQKFGLGALIAAGVLGAALGSGVLYLAMKSRPAAPLPQTPLSGPLAPLQERPQSGAEPHEAGKPVPPREGPKPKALPGQPKELSSPARPTKPRRQEAEPVATPAAPALPAPPSEPEK